MLTLRDTLDILECKAYPAGRPATMNAEDQLIHLTIAWEQLRQERSDLVRIRRFFTDNNELFVIVENESGAGSQTLSMRELSSPPTW